MRIAIINDGASWFVRRIAGSRHDITTDQMVYTCDEPIAGPCESLPDAVTAAQTRMATWVVE